MSLQDMLDEEPPVTLQRQVAPGAKDAAGLPLHALQDVYQLQGRIIRGNARQQAAWLTLGIEADAEFLTMDLTLQNGDFIQVSVTDSTPTPELWRIVGTWDIWREKGTIPAYAKYALVQERRI
jgi:hypothetical protein